MKYISLTFDDGREDNYSVAYPIMKQFGLCGTIYCTTGYIDGTWTKPEDWKSAEKPITIKELHELNNSGWEIALHGDRHTTDVDDLTRALKKINSWGFKHKPVGFSMPNSKIEKEKLDSVIEGFLGTEISYIRIGRRINTKKLSSKILFALSSYGKIQWAYNMFNNHNLNRMQGIDFSKVHSVVVRNNDDPKMIIKFLKQIPDDNWVVLMLHSILPENHELYGTDPWNWSSNRFEYFCNEVKNLQSSGSYEVLNVSDIKCMYM